MPRPRGEQDGQVRVLNRGMDPRHRSEEQPSSAIAKKMRGEASMMPFSELNVEIITNDETTTTPVCPKIAIIVSAAISGDRPMASTAVT